MTEEERTQEIATSGREAEGLNGLVRRVLTIEPKYLDIAFTAAFLAFMGILVVKSFQLEETSKIMPLVVAVPTFFFLAFILLMLVSDRLSALAEHYTQSSLLGVDKKSLGGDEDAAEEEHDPEEALFRQRKRQVMAFASVLSLLVLVYFIGYMAAIPVFLITLYRLWAKQSWPVTIATTALVWVFVLVIFYMMLGVRLYTGVFDIDIMSILL